jgi:DNA-binding transcriptional LysR family regulator
MLHNRLLTYIDEVARLGSIRAASRKLNVASSAINRQIIALETDLGTQIFERLPRRLRLTTAGEILVAHVRETLRGHERMTERINDMTGLRWGRITVATIGTIAAEVLPGVVTSFRARYPRSSVDVRLVNDVLGQVEG